MNNDVLMEKLVQLEAKLDAVHADVKKGNADPILPCGPDDAAKVPPWTSEWIEKVLYTPAQLSAACDRLGAEITAFYAEHNAGGTDEDLVVVGLLSGVRLTNTPWNRTVAAIP